FAAVADEWRRRAGGVIELLGPAEAMDEPVAGAITARDWQLGDVAALLGSGDGYAGNGSGVSHLAAASGRRGAAVLTSTDAARGPPSGRTVVAIGDGATGHEPAASPTISAARVLEALRQRESLTSLDPGSSVRA